MRDWKMMGLALLSVLAAVAVGVYLPPADAAGVASQVQADIVKPYPSGRALAPFAVTDYQGRVLFEILADGGAVGLDGGSFFPPAASGSSGCTLLNDVNFAAASSVTCASDGSCTIAGLAWTKGNSSADNVALANVTTEGLTVQPVASTDYSCTGPTRTLPYVWIPLSTLAPTWDYTQKLRLTVYIASSNESASYDNAVFGFDTNSTALMSAYKRGYGTTAIGHQTLYCSSIYSTGFVSAASYALGASNKVGALGLSFPAQGVYSSYGAWSSGFPAFSAMTPAASQFDAVNTAFTYPSPSGFGVFLGAQRAGSGTAAYKVVFQRLKLEACP